MSAPSSSTVCAGSATAGAPGITRSLCTTALHDNTEFNHLPYLPFSPSWPKQLPKDMIARSFKWTMGDDGAGHQMMICEPYGGYYLDAGCADPIIRGEVGLLHFEQINLFVEDGARLHDGSMKPADLIVLATGFDTQEVVIGR